MNPTIQITDDTRSYGFDLRRDPITKAIADKSHISWGQLVVMAFAQNGRTVELKENDKFNTIIILKAIDPEKRPDIFLMAHQMIAQDKKWEATIEIEIAPNIESYYLPRLQEINAIIIRFKANQQRTLLETPIPVSHGVYNDNRPT